MRRLLLAASLFLLAALAAAPAYAVASAIVDTPGLSMHGLLVECLHRDLGFTLSVLLFPPG